MNRRERRASQARDGIVRAEDGRRMAVIRPEDPAKALALAKLAEETQDTELLANLPDRVGCNYSFVGWLSPPIDGRCHIVDDKGVYLEALKPGDSFVTFENDDPRSAQEKPS